MEKNKVIIDSNIFIAYYFKGDLLNEIAKNLLESLKGIKLLLPYCVIEEVSTVLTYRFNKRAATHFLNDISQFKNTLLIESNIKEEAKFFKSKHKRISFTDSTLLMLAKEHNAKLFSFDKQLINFYKKSS